MNYMRFSKVLSGFFISASIVGGTTFVNAYDYNVNNLIIEIQEEFQPIVPFNGAQFRVNSNTSRNVGFFSQSQGGSGVALSAGEIVTVQNTNPVGVPSRISVRVNGRGNGFIELRDFSLMTHIGGPAF
ncbi:MAG: hypothetical protein LBD23_08405 [Oscillospiraceae bacterium]|jgi:hypothetical protein|nr:hypothetical protein [Oscillospiraceae bacterium]